MNKELEKTEQNSANPIPDITPNSEVPDIIIGAKKDMSNFIKELSELINEYGFNVQVDSAAVEVTHKAKVFEPNVYKRDLIIRFSEIFTEN